VSRLGLTLSMKIGEQSHVPPTGAKVKKPKKPKKPKKE
jgi:hypothetical protein